MIVWNRIARIFRRELPSARSPEQDYLEARIGLGEQMVAAGIDDGILGAKIATLDERIRRAREQKQATDFLQAERKVLILQLADAALEVDAPLPGADREYQNARACQAALRRDSLPRKVEERRVPAGRAEPGGICVTAAPEPSSVRSDSHFLSSKAPSDPVKTTSHGFALVSSS